MTFLLRTAELDLDAMYSSAARCRNLPGVYGALARDVMSLVELIWDTERQHLMVLLTVLMNDEGEHTLVPPHLRDDMLKELSTALSIPVNQQDTTVQEHVRQHVQRRIAQAHSSEDLLLIGDCMVQIANTFSPAPASEDV